MSMSDPLNDYQSVGIISNLQTLLILQTSFLVMTFFFASSYSKAALDSCLPKSQVEDNLYLQ